MIKYKVFEAQVEVPYREAKKNIAQGCTLCDPTPLLIATFMDREKAEELFNTLKSKVEYSEGWIYPYFIVTEYWLDISEYDDDDELARIIDCDVSDGDYTNRYLN